MSFSDSELSQGIPSEDPLTITALIVACKTHRLLIDGGSVVDVLFKCTLDQMDIDPRLIQQAQGNLVGFSGTRVAVIGEITLPVVIEDDELRVSKQIKFTIVDCDSPRNDILGLPFLAKFMSLPSTCHQKLKFPTKAGTGESCSLPWTKSNQEAPCPVAAPRQTNIIDTHADDPHLESMDSDFEVALDPTEPNKKVRISTHVPNDMVELLVKLLQEYKELFA
ncbi:unnamed protein product [Linum trigynum]|uniref:Uncharacterized protein n=1 Tax=Linum trigynum TaxID=586398 RepID=A0AAV2CAC3_9ROSI